jgi:hypothetical protein
MRIAFEGILLALLVGVGILMVGVPLVKVFRIMFPKKTDSLKEAQERLEIARKEREAARLNKEAEKVYSELYDEVLEEASLEDEFLEEESDRRTNGK